MIKNYRRRCTIFFIMTLLLFIFSGCGSSSDEATSSSDPEAIRKRSSDQRLSASVKINPRAMAMYPNTRCLRKFWDILAIRKNDFLSNG